MISLFILFRNSNWQASHSIIGTLYLSITFLLYDLFLYSSINYSYIYDVFLSLSS